MRFICWIGVVLIGVNSANACHVSQDDFKKTKMVGSYKTKYSKLESRVMELEEHNKSYARTIVLLNKQVAILQLKLNKLKITH